MLSTEQTKNFIEAICSEVRKAQENKGDHKLIFEEKANTENKNEFILFIKPNVTIKEDSIKLENIVKLVFDKIVSFGLDINMIKVLPGTYLESYNIMAQHYGVINKLSKNVRKAMNDQGKEKFKELFGISFEDADVYGGHEFLDKFEKFTPFALSVLWQSTGFQKLTSGTYGGRFTFDGHDYYLVNGFHPRQLNHFYLPGRSIVVLALSSNTDWSVARNDLIGATDPSKAKKGSIRNELLIRQKEFGIPIMNTAYNGVHLSAGPVEALNELIRFCSDFTDVSKHKKIDDFRIGRLLLESFATDQIKDILDNERVELNGHLVSSFDITEEKNSDEIVSILKSCY